MRPLVLAALLVSCATVPAKPPQAVASLPRDPSAAASPLELYETWPLGTALDHAELRDAADVWPEVISRATQDLDLAGFYFSNQAGQGPKSNPPGSLERTLRAVEAAAARGVKVRVLADLGFERAAPENAETLKRLETQPNIQVRRIDWKGLANGVLHAKYFVVDRNEACLGSQNFDWRALEHIVELGLRVRTPAIVRALQSVFDSDWELAAPGAGPAAQAAAAADATASEGDARLTFIASPKTMLPAGIGWDLPKLIALIDGARTSVQVQLLTYKSSGGEFGALEEALLRAATRGVRVELLVSHWSKRKSTVEGLQRLVMNSAVQVRFFNTPEWSGGFIPYARTAHAKFLVVDGASAWLGTSNWEKGYFLESRNVGVVIEGGLIPKQLEAFFDAGWSGPFAEEVDPVKRYEAPVTH